MPKHFKTGQVFYRQNMLQHVEFFLAKSCHITPSFSAKTCQNTSSFSPVKTCRNTMIFRTCQTRTTTIRKSFLRPLRFVTRSQKSIFIAWIHFKHFHNPYGYFCYPWACQISKYGSQSKTGTFLSVLLGVP